MNKISVREKIGYSFGELSASSLWQGIIFFLPIFYTDIFGITPAQAALLFGIVKVFDALNDPIMGIIADRTRTRWGKYRPYLLWFSIPIGISFVLMFTTPALEGNMKLLYAYSTHFLVLIFYTILMVPYNTLLGVITPNQAERTSLSSYKMIFAYGATMLVQIMVVNLVEKLGNGNDALGYKYTMMIVALISMVALLIVFFSTRERVQPILEERTHVGQDLKDLMKNRPWLILVCVSLVSLIYIVIRSGAIMYYFEYYVGSKKLAAAFMVSGTFAVLVGVFPTAWLSRKIGKIRLYIISMIIVTVSSALFFFVQPHNIVLLFTLQIIFSLASGPSFPLLFSMLADTADYSEWKTGRRATGLIYSTATFAQKTGVAIGVPIVMVILGSFSYVPNAIQGAESLLGIRLLLSLIPALIAAGATACLFLYKLDEKTLAQIGSELEERRKVEK